jgi:micrococcal nuclease
MPYEYNAKVNKVVDGDTIEVDIDLGFNVRLADQKVRLLGIDTPESRTADAVEKVFGLASKDFVKHFIESADNWIVLRTHKLNDDNEKFGRLLGEVIHPKTGKVLNEELVTNGFAVKYMGENKLDVRPQHLINRKRLIDAGLVKLTYKQAGITG